MLAWLEGTVAAHDREGVVLAVGGVGYAIALGRALPAVGTTARIFITEIIREDRHDLYGFLSPDDRELFQLLLNVQGVGPKVAQKVLGSAATATQVRERIQAGDLALLTAVPGVGKKTAQKIILELKGVLAEAQDATPSDECAAALLDLGYHREDIAAVLPLLPDGSLEDRVKSALQRLGRPR